MKKDDFNNEWEKLLDNVSFTKNFLLALALIISYILYINHQIGNYKTVLILISYSVFTYIVIKRQTSKCFNYINYIWHKGLTDYRYCICLEELYLRFNNLEPYAIKVWSDKDGYQIIPYKLYKSKSKSIF